MPQGHSKTNISLAIIFVVVITSLIYANSLKNGFIYDDYLVIVNNNFVKSWNNLPLLFSKSYLSPLQNALGDAPGGSDIHSGEASYRPVVTLSYFMDYFLFGLKPFGYHLTNLLIHIINALLVFLLIFSIAGDKRIALLASLLFALHPVNSEAVNVISFREDLLALLFYLSALILYIRSRGYIFTLALFALALFSKEMALTLPAILVLYDYFFVFNADIAAQIKKSGFRYLGFIVILAFYAWIEFFLMKNTKNLPLGYPGGNFYTNMLTMSRVITHYIYLMLLPIRAHHILHGNLFISRSLSDLSVIFSILVLIFCFIFAFKIRKRFKIISFSIFWFFITLLPVCNIVKVNNFVANRYLYIPILGFCFLMAEGLLKLSTMKTSLIQQGAFLKIARILLVIILASYCVFTVIRNLSWRDSWYFWSEMADIYPDSFEAHSNLGYFFLEKGLYDKAIEQYNTAIRLTPNGITSDDYKYLGACYYKQGRIKEAKEAFVKALKINPYSDSVNYFLGICFKNEGLYAEAAEYFKQAISINPGLVQANRELDLLSSGNKGSFK